MGYRWTSDIFQFKSTKIVGKGRLPRSENGVIIKRFTHTSCPPPETIHFLFHDFLKGAYYYYPFMCAVNVVAITILTAGFQKKSHFYKIVDKVLATGGP